MKTMMGAVKDLRRWNCAVPGTSASLAFLLFLTISTSFAQEQSGIRLRVQEKLLTRSENATIIGFGSSDPFNVSPDNERVAYVASVEIPKTNGVQIDDGRELYAVVDGKRGKSYSFLSLPEFSPDSKRVAHRAMHYKAQPSEAVQESMVVDGVESPRYDRLGYGPFQFSPDSKRTAYVACRAGKQFVVLDGAEGKAYSHANSEAIAISRVFFSPDSKRVAYSGFDASKGADVVVLDGKEVATSCHQLFGVFSPDSKRFACTLALPNEMESVFENGIKGPAYDERIYDLQFSPDSKHLVYSARRGKNSFLVVDGKERGGYEAIRAVSFSADSLRLAYAAKKLGKWAVVDNKSEGPAYDKIGVEVVRPSGCMIDRYWAETVGFSPDSKRLAYPAVRDGKAFVVVDGVEGKVYDAIRDPFPVFSPDSKRLTYVAERDGKLLVVVDDEEGRQRYDKPSTYNPIQDLCFTPDSKHVVYRAGDNIVVDGTEIRGYSFPTGSRIVFDKCNVFHLVVTKSGALCRLEVEIFE